MGIKGKSRFFPGTLVDSVDEQTGSLVPCFGRGERRDENK